MVVLEYLRDYFTHKTVFGESCKNFWSEVKYFKPLLHKAERKAIWLDFKKKVKSESKGGLLRWWKLMLTFTIVLIACTFFTKSPLLCALFIFVAIFFLVLPIINLWQLRKIFHEVDQENRKKNRPVTSATQTSASRSPTVGTRANPNQTGITPRRKPLH